MRGRRWLLLLLFVPFACLEQPQGVTGESGEVTVLLRGLIALESTNAGLRVLFLSPQAEPHPPTLSVDLARLTGSPKANPDMTIPDDMGRGLAAWRIEEVTLVAGNVEEVSLTEIAGDVKEKVMDADKTKIRWVPHMENIYGSKQKLVEPAGLVAARGTFAVGRLEPVFDAPKNKTQLFTIGERKCTAVADAVRLQLKMKDSLQPLLTFKTKGGQDGQILVSPGTTVALAAMPQNQPKGHLEHLHHYYALLEDAEHKPASECVEGDASAASSGPKAPTGFPVRCAPIKFP